MEKRLLLLAEVVKKAINITDVHFTYSPPHDDRSCLGELVDSLAQKLGETRFPRHEHNLGPIEEFVEFLGGALDKLSPSPQEITSFKFDGDLLWLSPIFPPLAAFLGAKKETIQHLSINDHPLDVFEERPVNQIHILLVLLEALRDCSYLESVHLRLHPSFSFNDLLLEHIIYGKAHLRKLGVFNWDVLESAVLDSGIQLVELRCDFYYLEDYSEEIGHLGLRPTDVHPLLTVKRLSIEADLLPSFLLMPNLEHLEFLYCIHGDAHVKPFDRTFLTEGSPGGWKEMTCEIQKVLGVGSAEQLADKVQEAFACQGDRQSVGRWENGDELLSWECDVGGNSSGG